MSWTSFGRRLNHESAKGAVIGRTILKRALDTADIMLMTATSPVFEGWDTKPAGKAIRIGLAVAGVSMAVLLLVASMVGVFGWASAVLGMALGATSVLAARVPSVSRLVAVAIAFIAISLLPVI